jgi:glycosyltransferase involved in cell wall biosynthesis
LEKIQVAIASVLKPLKDPRAYYRMGLSLRETNKYLINIIGFSIKNKSSEDLIKFTPIFCEKRTSWKRILVGVRLLKLLFQHPPKILIVTTYELLLPVVLLKPFLGYKIIYDVQENYSKNLRYNNSITRILRDLALGYILFIEKVSGPFIDHYFFAEQCYREEMPEIENFTVLENKFYGNIQPVDPICLKGKSSYHFLIAGTLTEVYGIVEAIQWYKEVLKQFPASKLKLVGYIPVASYRENILKELEGMTTVEAHLAEQPLPYSMILNAYKGVDFCLMPYHQIPSISPKYPSKLYESMALGIPALFSPNPAWKALVETCQGGAEMDFQDLQNASLNFSQLLQQEFFSSPAPQKVLWKSDEDRFLKVIADLEG